MSEMAAVIGWYGPYWDVISAKEAADKYYGAGLYIVFGYYQPSTRIGSQFAARGRPRLLYVGVGDPLSSRLTGNHHAIGSDNVIRITSIWLGEVMSHGKPGPRQKKIEPLIDSVEWAMVALLGPYMNKRKTSFPSQSFAIINRWYSAGDYETRLSKPVLIWPDIIECEGPNSPAYLCWLHERKVRRFDRPLRA